MDRFGDIDSDVMMAIGGVDELQEETFSKRQLVDKMLSTEFEFLSKNQRRNQS